MAAKMAESGGENRRGSRWVTLLGLLLSVFVWTGASPLARAEDEVTHAEGQLAELSSLLDEISLHVERHDLGRVAVLRDAGTSVLNGIHEHGLGNMDTMGRYQFMIVSYKYSTEFFDRVQTRRTAPAIARLRALADVIAQERDPTAVSRISEGVFQQLHKLVRDLIDVLPDGHPLRAKLVDLIPTLGNAISVAIVNGDQSPKTTDAGRALYAKVAALYPDFDAIRISDAAFDMAINIDGLNEFYLEYIHL